MPKATYMYWQKRFDKENPDKKIEEKIQEVRTNNKDYGYRRLLGELRNRGYTINKKRRFSEQFEGLDYRQHPIHANAENIVLTKVK